MHDPYLYRDRRPIAIWLIACLLLVACMVLIGGYTRLSGSGLSITSWKPIHGVIPPHSIAQWEQEFTAYKASPQYRAINRGMTLEAFKTIFWPEFIHRLLGRAVGAVFFLPFFLFILRHSLTARFGWRLAFIFALGGLQGLIGWLMVKSGLIDQPYVSPLRLALHLSTALLIFAMLFWSLLDILPNQEKSLLKPGRFRLNAYYLWFFLLCLQIVLGAFMAGLHAGLMYNTWPGMNGHFIPEGLGAPPLLANIAFIQFMHRNVAVLVVLGFLLWWYFCRSYVKNVHLGKRCALIAAIIAVQFALGVATLLHQAPLDLALTHQMVALLLFIASVALLHRLKKG